MIEQTSSWLKQAYWNPAPGSNVGLGLDSAHSWSRDI